MSAHPIMAQALAPFAPPVSDAERTRRLEDECRRMVRLLERWKAEYESLLRMPFQVEVQTRGAGRNGPAEYDYVTADEDDVRDAVDALIDRHIDELEADVKRRMQLRAEADV